MKGNGPNSASESYIYVWSDDNKSFDRFEIEPKSLSLAQFVRQFLCFKIKYSRGLYVSFIPPECKTTLP